MSGRCCCGILSGGSASLRTELRLGDGRRVAATASSDAAAVLAPMLAGERVTIDGPAAGGERVESGVPGAAAHRERARRVVGS